MPLLFILTTKNNVKAKTAAVVEKVFRSFNEMKVLVPYFENTLQAKSSIYSVISVKLYKYNQEKEKYNDYFQHGLIC